MIKMSAISKTIGVGSYLRTLEINGTELMVEKHMNLQLGSMEIQKVLILLIRTLVIFFTSFGDC